MTRRAPSIAKGVTFLEVVFSAALLSIAAATITSAYTFIERSSMLDETRVGAHEIGHRLILQFMDDPTAMPPTDSVLPLGRHEYRYLLREEILAASQVDGENLTVRHTQHVRSVGLIERFQARLVLITVDVYQSVDGRRAAMPIATISRIFDPLHGVEEDPEAFQKQIIHMFADDPATQQILLNVFNERMRQQQQDRGASQDQRRR